MQKEVLHASSVNDVSAFEDIIAHRFPDDRPVELTAAPFDEKKFESHAFIKDLSDFLNPDGTSVEQPETETNDTLHALGRGALSVMKLPARAVSKVNQAASVANVEILSRIPGFDSKEEKIEKARIREEKYRFRDDDDEWTKWKKRFGRNTIKAAAWTPVVLMGIAGTSSLVKPFIPLITEHLPIESLPFMRTVQATDIVIGGHTQGDPNASGYVQSLQTAGIYDPSHNNVDINWSAQMGGLPGDTMPMNVSDAQGAQQVYDAVQNAGGAPVRIISFSQGTEATSLALNQIAAENGGRVPDNVTVILAGTPSGDLGIGNNPVTNGVMGSFLDQIGFQTKVPIPPGAHVIVRTDIADPFGNGGHQSVLKVGEMLMGPGHQVDGPDNSVLLSTYQKGGVTYEVWGDPQGINDPIMRAMRNAGIPVTPQADKLMNDFLPYTPPNAPGPLYGNANQVMNDLPGAIDSQTHVPGLGNATVNAMQAVDPNARGDMQSYLNLEKIPDQLADAQANPQNAPADVQAATNEGMGAVTTTLSFLQRLTGRGGGTSGGYAAPAQHYATQAPSYARAPYPRYAAPAAPRYAAPRYYGRR